MRIPYYNVVGASGYASVIGKIARAEVLLVLFSIHGLHLQEVGKWASMANAEAFRNCA